MYLDNLSVINFKSLVQVEVQFDTKINCFVGNNGQGKTNLLDAIYYLSMCKSYISTTDSQVLKHGEDFFVLQGKYNRNNTEENIYCGLKKGEGKVFKRNGKEYERLADHIGFLPVVMVSPIDGELVEGSGEQRRKYVNGVISQIDKVYLDEVIRYNRLLSQRNSLLKTYSKANFSYDLIEAIDIQLSEYAAVIHSKRKAFVEQLIGILQDYYNKVSGGQERVSIRYKSHLNDSSPDELFKNNIERDRVLQYTSVGIHRDDIVLLIDDYPIRTVGSQGQQKTFLIALKLAQFDFIAKVSGIKPILLLDDIFDKLDANRVHQLIDLVAHDGFGQIFITDTNKHRLEEVLGKVSSGYRFFNVENGNFELVESK
jgi:DNA replication and repair protein RecF